LGDPFTGAQGLIREELAPNGTRFSATGIGFFEVKQEGLCLLRIHGIEPPSHGKQRKVGSGEVLAEADHFQ
jgi:hypothetical protein